MFFRQLYDQSLAQASYVIGCQATGEAIVVDPLRDIAPYLEVARAEGLRITHITETHIHADFVSGARELQAATGARLFLSAEGGTDWQYGYAATDGATLLRDGSQIMVGNLRFDVMHTPGHTPEHIAFVVTDTPRGAGPMGILTGDFVFVGDVGRPDLLERAAKVANTMEAGARTLFQSLDRFRALPDHLQVWPGHGAGSACGKALGAVPSTTVGYEKLANWAVAETNEELFVQQVLAGQPEPPRYFADMKRINREGPALLNTRTPFEALSTAEVLDRLPADDVWVIDLRTAPAFADGHVPRTLSVPRGRSFSNWVGSLVPIAHDVILLSGAPNAGGIDTPADVQQAADHLAAIGFDHVRGWTDAGSLLEAWQSRGHVPSRIPQLTSAALSAMPESSAPVVIDVRGQSEWSGGHLPGARHIPLGALPDHLADLPDGPIVVQCQSGARSAVATSLLHRAGRTDALNLVGGYQAWRAAGLTTV
jgi:hydroxyacylglutathione hydrolase